ncbi:hypothetical protein BDA99DRAFT_554423 [Phascolomyces articulosus]|uniref:Heterokaryon incompatibility domain-containing protein n=1 Tax=Phascolomyces articulosus TaxID=60185 RepID=A0AAD5PJJ3_9FUNG|nr:hypothetical protein BDA99DRAFT_554423 [Phascolomyces articulosus]
MYITYCRNQRTLGVVDTTQYRRDATAGEYRPTHLIRVSDWKKVPGKQVETGYCTLSFVWEQSGDVVQKENVRVKFLPATRSKATIKHVTYEELLQQICKDFEIEYLWYDKICIAQSDDEIKLREIKKMHKIYGNACYTVVIVPEVHIYDPKDFDTIDPVYDDIQASTDAWVDIIRKSLWWKRSWTLEDTMTSKRILVIGTGTQFWQHSLHTCDIPTTDDAFSLRMLGFANQQQGGGSVNQALSQAHFRSSSKEHDKIFSLANIFPDLFKNMKINYKDDINKTLIHFYRTIATHDLSILCFGSKLFENGEEIRVNTLKNHNLPSWTGVSGLHLDRRVTTTTAWLQSQHSIRDDMLFHISTKY